MRFLHWIIWHLHRLSSVVSRMVFGGESEWASNRALHNEGEAWREFLKARDRRKTGQPSLRVVIEVKPRIRPEPKPDEAPPLPPAES